MRQRTRNGRYTPPKRRHDFMADWFPTVALTGIPLKLDDDALNQFFDKHFPDYMPDVAARNCEYCDADLVIDQQEPGIWWNRVEHDPDCPYLAHLAQRIRDREAQA